MCENLTSEVMWHKNSRRNLSDLTFNEFNLTNAMIILMDTNRVLTVIVFATIIIIAIIIIIITIIIIIIIITLK